MGKSGYSKELLLNTKERIEDIMRILESKDLSIYMGGDNAVTLYKLHDNLYLVLLEIDMLISIIRSKHTPPPNHNEIIKDINEGLKTLDSFLRGIHEKFIRKLEKLEKEDSLEKNQ